MASTIHIIARMLWQRLIEVLTTAPSSSALVSRAVSATHLGNTDPTTARGDYAQYSSTRPRAYSEHYTGQERPPADGDWCRDGGTERPLKRQKRHSSCDGDTRLEAGSSTTHRHLADSIRSQLGCSTGPKAPSPDLEIVMAK